MSATTTAFVAVVWVLSCIEVLTEAVVHLARGDKRVGARLLTAGLGVTAVGLLVMFFGWPS